MNPLTLGIALLLGLGGLIGGGQVKKNKTTAKAQSVQPVAQSSAQPTAQPTPTPTQKQFGRVSYYLPTGGQTSTGTTPVSGKTAAISRELLSQIPMGSLIRLPNGQVVRVEDLTASHIKNTLDLYYSDPSEIMYPEKGLMRNVPYEVTGRDTSGLKYNY